MTWKIVFFDEGNTCTREKSQSSVTFLTKNLSGLRKGFSNFGLNYHRAMQRLPFVYVAISPLHGRGVFTAAEIPEGSLIESCPVILLPEDDMKLIHETVLHDYYFYWGEEEKMGAIALGFGSIYNHSDSPNAECLPDAENLTFDFYALRDIKPGEEILTHYLGDPDDKSPLWFNRKS